MTQKFSRIMLLLFLITSTVGAVYALPTVGGADVTSASLAKPTQAQGTITISLIGEIESLSDDALTIDGQLIAIDANTIIVGNLEVGTLVFVDAVGELGSGLTAVYIEVLDNGQWGQVVSVVGFVTDVSTDTITIDSMTAVIDDDTEIIGTLEVGTFAFMEAMAEDNNILTALYIEVLDGNGGFPIFHAGYIDAFDDTAITVDGWTFGIAPTTQISGELAIDAFAFVEAVDNGDGTFTAVLINVIDDGNGQNTVTITGVVDSISDTEIIVEGQAATINDDTEIVGNIEAGDTVYMEALVNDDNSLTALYIEEEDGNTPGDAIPFFGLVETVSDTLVVVDGQPFIINDDTEIEGTLEVNVFVFLLAEDNGDGTFTALSIEVWDNSGGPGVTISLVGTVEAISNDSITVEGITAAINDTTIIIGDIVVSDTVHLEAVEDDFGDLIATRIEEFQDPNHGQFPFFGFVNSISTTEIVVEGLPFIIDANTDISGTIEVGSFVFLLAEDNGNGTFTALSIEVWDNSGGSGITISLVGTVEAISDDSITVDGITAAISDTTIIIGDIVVSDTVYLEAIDDDFGNLTATYIEAFQDPNQGNIPFFGFVDSISTTEIIVEGLPFIINANTDISGTVAVGSFVFLLAEDNGDGTFTALSIEVWDNSGGPGITISLVGTVEAISDDSITVDGITAAINDTTIIIGDIVVSDTVRLEAVEDDFGDLIATRIEEFQDPNQGQFPFFGMVDTISDTEIVVDGWPFIINDDTEISGTVEAGVFVFLLVQDNGDSTFTALSIEVWDNGGQNNTISIVGTVEAISDSSITVDGITAAINDDTIIIGDIVISDTVYLEAVEEAGILTATSIELLTNPPNDPILPIIGTIEALTDDAVTVDGQLYLFDENSEIIGNLEVGGLVLIMAIDNLDGTYTVLLILALDDDGTNEISLLGYVDAISSTEIIVDGTLFLINDDTDIIGDPAIGDFVYIAGLANNDGTYTALYIELMDDDGVGDHIVSVIGYVDSLSDVEIVVDGTAIAVTADTDIVGNVTVGTLVYVEAEEVSGGALTALHVESLEEDSATGQVKAISPNALWVGGLQYGITSQTRIVGHVTLNSAVYIGATHNNDGTRTAHYIEALEDNNVATKLFIPLFTK